MDTPKPKPAPKRMAAKIEPPNPRRTTKSKPRETRTKTRKVDWDVRLPNKSAITVSAETEIKAVELVANMYGVIPDSVTRKRQKKEFVRPDHLTYRPFSKLESMLNGSVTK